MTADDTYTVHARLEGGAVALLHSTCAARGQFVATTKVIGTSGAAWMQGEEVWVDTGAGPTQVPLPDDLPLVAPDPPPAELLHTAYDMWHSMGIDLAPYTRVYSVLRDRVLGRPVAADPAAATFADGAAVQAVMDAVHRSSDKGAAWIDVERV
jgi:predicted dehydrogenase